MGKRPRRAVRVKLPEILKPYLDADGEQKDNARKKAWASAILIDRPDLRATIIAFGHIPIRWNRPPGTPPKDERILWQWAWEGVTFSMTELAIAAGLDERTADMAIETLKGSRLIFPDGQVSMWAKVVLEAEVAKLA